MKLFRKKVNFFDLLAKQCEITKRGMEALYKYCSSVGEENHEENADSRLLGFQVFAWIEGQHHCGVEERGERGGEDAECKGP